MKLGARGVLAIVAVLLLSQAYENNALATESEQVTLNIPEQPLQEALTHLAHQTGLQILFQPELVEGRTSTKLDGVYSPVRAIELLLNGAPIEVVVTGKDTIVLRSKPEASTPTTSLVSPKADVSEDEDVGSANGAADLISEIVVTAQRRAEAARDVPISISSPTGEDIVRSGVTDTRDLHVLVPGLKVDRVMGWTAPAIRGVTTQLTLPGVEPAVVTYVDGVYDPSMASGTFDLPDVERIDVLKGPQGTLFGRNATGGAILVSTKEPSFDPSGKLDLTFGNYDETTVKAFLTGPLSDSVAGSISGFFRQSDGYLRDVLRDGKRTGGDESWLLRGKLKYQVNDWLALNLMGYVSRRDDGTADRGTALKGNSIDVIDPAAIIPTGSYDVANDGASNTVEARGGHFIAAAETRFGTLTATSGYSESEAKFFSDVTFGIQPTLQGGVVYINDVETEAFTQEITLASDSKGRFNYVIGGSYLRSEGAFNPVRAVVDLQPAPADINIWTVQRTQAYGAFGELFLDLTEQLRLIGGLRHTREEREAWGTIVPVGGKPDLPKLGSKTFKNTSPRVSLIYKFNPDTNAYATYSRGFKSGFFDTGFPVPPLVVLQPEKISAYEVGLKSRASDWLDVNVATFYYDYKDMQVSSYVDVGGGLIAAQIQNAASAEIKGLDVEATMRPVDGFAIQLGLSVLDAKYNRFPRGIATVPNLNPDGSLAGGNSSAPRDLSGKRLIRSPKWTLNLTPTYSFQLAGGAAEVSAQIYHSDEFFFENNNRVKQPEYTTVGLRLAWSPQGAPWTASLYGKNLTDEEIYQGVFISDIADGVFWAAPRTYGVGFSYEW